MPTDEQTVYLRIPAHLYEKLVQAAGCGGFGGPHDFVVFLLEELFRADLKEIGRQEANILRNRLRDLGYL